MLWNFQEWIRKDGTTSPHDFMQYYRIRRRNELERCLFCRISNWLKAIWYSTEQTTFQLKVRLLIPPFNRLLPFYSNYYLITYFFLILIGTCGYWPSFRVMQEKYGGNRVFWNGTDTLLSSKTKTIISIPATFRQKLPPIAFEAQLLCNSIDQVDWNDVKMIALDAPLMYQESFLARLQFLRDRISDTISHWKANQPKIFGWFAFQCEIVSLCRYFVRSSSCSRRTNHFHSVFWAPSPCLA